MTIIETTLDKKTLTDLVVEPVAKTVSEPKLTEETVNAIIAELKVGGGYGDIAVKVGFDKCTKAQVVEVARKMQERIAELNAPKVVEEVITK